jgi:hypothetical protein
MIDFPNAPTLNQVFTAANGSTWIWDGAKWASTSAGTGFLPLAGGTMVGDIVLAHDPPAALNPATKQYVDTPVASLWSNIRYKNRVINGDMSVDQRNGGALVAATGNYAVDRWKVIVSVASKGNVGQSSTSGFTFPNYLTWTTSAAYAVAAADYFMFRQFVEGCNFNDAMWGTANAQPVTLEFWAYSSLTGMFSGSVRNAAANRCYVFTYTIATASVFTKFKITIPGDTTGTWYVAANADALELTFSLGMGANNSSSAGSWQAGGFASAPGAVSVVGTFNAYLYITGVALMVGAAASNAEPEFKKFSDNLIDCCRYFWKGQSVYNGAVNVISGVGSTAFFPTSQRASPTFTTVGSSNSNVGAISYAVLTGLSAVLISATTSATGGFGINVTYTADADF